MEAAHHELDKPIYGVMRNHKITQSREDDEPTNQKRDLSCYYRLRENPKKKSQKSPEEPMKKILFRCEECGKGFRYEKCLSNHQAGMHFQTNQKVTEETLKSLCSSLSLVKKKKRSKRLIRYKKTQFSCSFTTFCELRSGFATNDDEFEVAECLIQLSKSSPKFVNGLKLVAEAVVDANPETPKASYDSDCLPNKKLRKGGEFQSWFFSNGHKLMEESVDSYETASFLRNDNIFDHLKRRNTDAFESVFLSGEQKLLKEEITTPEACKEPVSFLGHKFELDQQKLQKAGEFGTKSKLASFLGEKNELDQQKLRKASDFESGFHRTELGIEAMECSDLDIGTNTESDKKNFEHQCRLCNKIFSSYQALGGHQTFHRVSKSKSKMICREESVEEPKVESVTVKKEKKTHKCSISSKKFKSAPALGGHKKCPC